MRQSASKANSRKLQTPQGDFELTRQPPDTHLQAWDAADEYLLAHIDEQRILPHRPNILILNDAFGALAVALADHAVFSWSDSCVAHQALRNNLMANGFGVDQVITNDGIGFPRLQVDCALIKLPKSLAMLEHQLYALRPLLHPDSRIIAAAMSRNIHHKTLALFTRILGPATTTRALRKSRLIFVKRDISLVKGQSRFPDSYELQADRRYRLVNHAGLFSRDRLDRGTSLMIEYLPSDERFRRIVDLGCGNGVLGIVAASLNPWASLWFSDESYMAVASAEVNFHRTFDASRCAKFTLADGLPHLSSDSQDLVLVNPPFHQQYQIGDSIAWQMFKDAHRVLAPGGELLVVGNRHLGYHSKLKKIFGRCETIATDNKFVILRSY